MCRLRNIALESVTDGRTDRQTDDGQSDPYVSHATQKANSLYMLITDNLQNNVGCMK